MNYDVDVVSIKVLAQESFSGSVPRFFSFSPRFLVFSSWPFYFL